MNHESESVSSSVEQFVDGVIRPADYKNRAKLEKSKSDQLIILNQDGMVQVRLTKKMRECKEDLGEVDLDVVIQGTQIFYKWHMLKRLLEDGVLDPYKLIEGFLEKDALKFNEGSYWKAVDAIEMYNRGL